MRWNLSLLLILILCSCIMTRDSDWPMIQHDPQHSGYSSARMPEFLQEKWVYKDPGKIGAFLVASEDTLFASQGGFLSALTMEDGSALWSVGTLKARYYPAVRNKSIYVGAPLFVRSYDVDTGETLWKHEIPFVDVWSSPIVVGDHVIIGGGRPHPSSERAQDYARRIVCFHGETGDVVWEFFAHSETWNAPAYRDGRIYANDAGRHVYCLNAENGSAIWETEVEGGNSSPVSVGKNHVFVGSIKGVTCLDCETGKVVWEFNCSNTVSEIPAIAYRRIFFGSAEEFYCLEIGNGELIWKIETGSRISCSAVVADGKVVFGTCNGFLYSVDAKSGEIYETIQLDGGIDSLALSDGKLFVGQWDGKITCFEGSAPHELSSSVFIGIVIVFLFIALLLVVWIRTRRR
jgi:outer membrane protein assembly factor BamB